MREYRGYCVDCAVTTWYETDNDDGLYVQDASAVIYKGGVRVTEVWLPFDLGDEIYDDEALDEVWYEAKAEIDHMIKCEDGHHVES